ncbi:hypothetical protein GC163_18180 [bacterium]|nr:hypothetical protein [bacterium]
MQAYRKSSEHSYQTTARAGLLALDYLKELLVVGGVLLTVLLGFGMVSVSEPESSTARRHDSPIYQVGFVGETGQIWVHSRDSGIRELAADSTPQLISELGEPLPFPKLAPGCRVARSSGSLPTTITGDHLGRFMLARGSKVHTYFDAPWIAKSIIDVCVSAHGETAYALNQNDTIQQWKWDGHEFRQREFSIPGDHQLIRVSPDGDYLAITLNLNELLLWDTNREVEIQRLAPHKKRIAGMAWSPDSQRLATCGEDGVLRLWNRITGDMLWEQKVESVGPLTIVYSPMGDLIAVGGFDQQVTVWHANSGELAGVGIAHSAAIRALSFNPTGNQLISASLDGQLQRWLVTNQNSLVPMNSHAQEFRTR